MKFLLKFLGVSAIVLGAAGAGYLAYSYFVSPEPAPVSSAPASSGPSPTTDASVKLESQKSTLGFWVNTKDKSIYYISDEGKINKSFGGRNEELSGQTIAGFNRIIPSPDGTKGIIVLSYTQDSIFSLYDTANNTWERLPKGTIAADFDPSSTKIAYLKNSGLGALFVLDLITKKTAEMMKFNVLDGDLSWVSKNALYFTPKPGPLSNNQQVFYIDIADKSVLPASGETGLSYLFSRDNQLALRLSGGIAGQYSLALIHQFGGFINNIPFLSWPDKCAFKKEFVYCAVPKSLPPRITIPDDYLKEKIFTEDVFVKYNTDAAAGDYEIVYEPQSPIDAHNLVVSENKILFRNRYDGKIYSLKVKG